MIFGKARLVFAGNRIEQAKRHIADIPNAYLLAAFTDYEKALEHAHKTGCDAVFFDCGYRDGEYLKRELQGIDPDIIVSFRDRFYMADFGWCEHDEEYEDAFRKIAGACWYDPYRLPEEYRYAETLRSIDKFADAKAIYSDLPEEIKRHSERVAGMTVAVMEYANERRIFEGTEYEFDLYTGYMDYLYDAVLLHDIGKAILPRWLLEKNGPLTRAERTLYHMHVQFGDYLLMPIKPPLMIDESLCGEPLRRYMAQSCAAYHHELLGSVPLQNGHDPADTPIWAQVCGIANLWDNLIHEGLDGKVYTEKEASTWLEVHSNRLFTQEAWQVSCPKLG